MAVGVCRGLCMGSFQGILLTGQYVAIDSKGCDQLETSNRVKDKKKLMIIVIIAAVVIAVIAVVMIVRYRGHIIEAEEIAVPITELNNQPVNIGEGDGMNYGRKMFVDGELYTLVDTQEEADRIAEKYGITLKSFGYGVATYYVENERMDEVIKKGGKDKITFSRNGIMYLDNDIE